MSDGENVAAPPAPQPSSTVGRIGRRRFLGVVAATGGAVAGTVSLGALPGEGIPASAAPSTAVPSTAAAGAVYQDLAPNEVSLISIPPARIRQAVAKLDGVAHQLMEETKIPGMAVAVVHRNHVLYAKGFGVRKVGTSQKVNPDTVFQLASVSKPVGATVVAEMVGQKAVSWDDPVVKYLPDFALADPWVTQNVTIADLYSHRSGLPGHAGDLMEDMGYGQSEIIRRLRYYPLAPFRISYAYTNFGLTAAALAVAAAKGTSWEDLSHEALYGPLAMASTSSSYAAYQESTNHAALHARVEGKWQAKYTRDADAQTPAGGVSSSVSDMTKWLRLQLASGKFNDQQLVASEPLLETHLPQITSSPATSPSGRSGFYGLGFNVSYDGAGRLQLSHSGGFELGAATAISMLPSEQLGIVTLTNASPIGVPESLNASFLELVVAGRPTRDWLKAYEPQFAAMSENTSQLAGKKAPVNPAPALPAAAYTGTYANSLFGPALVESGPSGLVMTLGPSASPQQNPLTHWDKNTFSYLPSGEMSLGITAVTFAVGPTGQVTGMNVENLNGVTPITSELGTFHKS